MEWRRGEGGDGGCFSAAVTAVAAAAALFLQPTSNRLENFIVHELEYLFLNFIHTQAVWMGAGGRER